MAQIELKNINKTFDQKEIFHNFDLAIEKGEFLGIKGESGKGKTTLLNMIGLMEPCEGTITFDGEEISAFRWRATKNCSGSLNVKGE